jgi:phage protein D
MSENKHLTPVWIVYVDGSRLDTDHEGALTNIEINDFLNGISTFSILFDTSHINIRNSGLISLESEISIHMGYKDDVGEVFFGDVLGFKAILPEHGVTQLEVKGCNVLHRLNHGVHNKGFEDKSPPDAMKAVIDSYSLDAEVEDFGSVSPFFAVEGQTDYEFLLNTADAYGKNVFAAENTIYVAKEISVSSDEIIFEWGKSLISLDSEQNITEQISGFDYLGWDQVKNESFTGHAEPADISLKIGGTNQWADISKGGSGKFSGSTITSAQKDADTAKQAAIGLLQKNSFLFETAQGKAEGTYKLRPGMRVTIKMAGESFDGEYIAESVNHHFDHTGGYTTGFTLKRNMCP